jgi:uncharacterized protein
MNKSKHLVFIFILLFYGSFAQDIPDPMQPARLVNDFAGILSSEQIRNLENKLVAFNDSASTQIAVVIVKSLNGYDKNDFAQRLGQKWGVGQKGKQNGIVLLIKPRYPREKGEVSIQSGYGLEGVLPDITCKRIVENEMIPKLKDDDYYGAIDQATSTIISITRGEYTADQYNKRKKASPYGFLVPFIIIAIVFFLIRGSRGGTHSVGKNIPWWTALFLLGSMGRGHSGSWSDFQSGSGGFGGFGGGGGGGFGGFGGGGFGGGGAGGSW